jgi:hypothetical protein
VRTPDHCIGACRGVLVVVWTGHTTHDGVVASRRSILALGREHPEGVGLITIVEHNAPMPPGEVRDEVAKFLKESSDIIKASAVVFEGEGFRAAAVRSVVTGVSMLAKQAFPHRVFAHVDEAASWMGPKLPGAPKGEDLLKDIAGLRSGGGKAAAG